MSPNFIFELKSLPYGASDLSPHITENTISYHYGKHHKTYLDNLNKLVAKSLEAGESIYNTKSLEEIILKSWEKKDLPMFNNAAQVWNHDFYWSSMTPNGGDNTFQSADKANKFKDHVNKAFGSFDKMKELFIETGLGQFGSGWVWLVQKDDGSLELMKTPNAELPMIHGKKALLTSDVWEHTYYLDYQNKRADYLKTFLDKLVNWEFAVRNYS